MERMSTTGKKVSRYKKSLSCCIKECSCSFIECPTIHFFSFPKTRISQWVHIIQRHFPDYTYSKAHHICNQHFTEQHFSSTAHKRLNRFAFPNIFGGIVDESQPPSLEQSSAFESEYNPYITVWSPSSSTCSNIEESSENITIEPPIISTISISDNTTESYIMSEIETNCKIYENCCIQGCTCSLSENPTLHFFEFPKTMTSQWISIIQDHFPDYIYSSTHQICSNHFSKKHFTTSQRNKLSKFAYPDIFEVHPEITEESHSPSIERSHSPTNEESNSPIIEETHSPFIKESHYLLIEELSVSEDESDTSIPVLSTSSCTPSYTEECSENITTEPMISNLTVSDNKTSKMSSTVTKRQTRYQKYLKCCIKGCTCSFLENPKMHFFGFPNLRLSQWIKTIQSHFPDYTYSKNHRICNNHFNEKHFSSTAHCKLNRFAIPDIFELHPEVVGSEVVIESVNGITPEENTTGDNPEESATGSTSEENINENNFIR